ncbi:unnamed protein product [Symbiodinium sp. CCMP2592]|nr:unnamed protein product [Symbiodinium sp. CCMP2592]
MSRKRPAESMAGRVAFVGLGAMGYHMAGHLAKRHPGRCRVWNRSAEKARRHSEEFGSNAATSLAELSDSQVVVFCLPTSKEDEAIVEQVAPHLARDSCVVSCTSGEPGVTTRLATSLRDRFGVHFLDCPVSGGPKGAAAGSLTCMLGSDSDDAAESVMPFLDSFAKKVVRCGPAGAGHAVKAVNNALNVTHLLLGAEGLLALQRLGVDPQVALEAINGSSGRSLQTEQRLPQEVLTRRFGDLASVAKVEGSRLRRLDGPGRVRYPDVFSDYLRLLFDMHPHLLGKRLGETPPPGGRGRRDGSNKAPATTRLGEHGSDNPLQGAGQPAGIAGGKVLSLDMLAMQQLLEVQKEQILEANRTHAQGLLDALEVRHGQRITALEQTVTGVDTTVRDFASRLELVEQQLKQGVSSGGLDDKRRHTLVIGGWERDTRRGTILSEVEEALKQLKLMDLTDTKAFTTGPRRSVALLPFELRKNELESARKERMYGVLSGLMDGGLTTSAGKRLWAAVSKSKEQREIGGHCAWLKRALGTFSADLAGQLDLEYSSGSSWLGASMTGSATLPIPPGTDMRHIFVDERSGSKPWFDLKALKTETKLGTQQLRDALQQPGPASRIQRGKAAQCAGTRPVDRGFRVFGWNLGGCSADTLCDLVKTATREAVFDSDLFLLQELPRSRTGWATTTTKEGYRLVGHQGSSQWRGTGLLYSPLAWSVIRRVAKGKGTWFLLKSLRSSVQFWVATFHFTPGLTVQKHEQEVLEFLKGRPSDGRPVLLQGDSNAHLGWVAGSGAVEALGLEGKSIMMLDQFSAAGIRLCLPPSRQFSTPTSRPRREDCEGHQIDFGATKGVLRAALYIHEDSYMLQGTDHELLELRFWLRVDRAFPRHCSRPRVWTKGPSHIDFLDQDALRQLARRSWESARIRRATEGDWQAFRDETRVQATGWDLVYADAQACDPHQSVHQHLTEVYSGDDLPPLPPFVGPVQAFSIEELTKAVSQIRKGKSVGVDLTSRELLDGILQTTGGPEHLLEFMNRTLCTQTVPRDWNRPLVIMLAKTDSPTAPSDLRPIAVGSSAAKLFSRLLVNRIAPKLAPRTHSQCASSGRQTCDVVCSLWKLCELEREWKAGLGVVKVDVRKAFDSVNRAALLAALRARLGDTAEYRCFHALLVDVEAVLQTCWGSSLLAMKSGIKQGSIESPILFSFLMEVALEQARVKYSWDQGSHLFHDMLEEDLLYMDDGYLWGPDCRTLGVRLGQLAEVLQGFGLTLNIAKCVLYCSPYCPGPHKLRLHRVTLEASDHLPVMGLKMRVGMSMSELIQPLLSRARSKFWGLKHLFRSKTQAKGRVQLMHRVISNTALWCIAALPPDRPALALVNSFQALLLTWLLRLGKRADEDWPAFRKRAVRSARYSLHVAGCPRWSTCWLTRWWTFAGHRVRASQQQFPPISTILEMFRDRQWWQKAKDAGLSHPGRFFARLHSLDKAMDTVCGGPWRVYALDRAAWQAKLSTWIQQRDRVIPMCDRHPGFGAFYMYFLLPALGTSLPFFAQLPGVLAPIPDDYGNWPPIWFTEATLRGRDLAARGLRMSDALAMLARAASHRNFATYTNFASRTAVAIGNTLELPVSNLAPEEIHLDLRVWVTFVEAHILEEFLEHEYPFQQGLYEGLRNVNPNLASLPAPPQETMLRAQRREEFNQLRRDPPFIRHLRASTGPAFRSHSLMRLEWVGRCVGDFHDLYHAGYNLHGVFEEMVAFIRARDNGSYRSLALPYYREVLSQLGTFLGSPDSSRPPQASEWVADRESELWYLYNYHGLEARDVDVDDISVGNASSSNRSCAEEAADDVSSLMDRKGVNKRWLKNAPTRRYDEHLLAHGLPMPLPHPAL